MAGGGPESRCPVAKTYEPFLKWVYLFRFKSSLSSTRLIHQQVLGLESRVQSYHEHCCPFNANQLVPRLIHLPLAPILCLVVRPSISPSFLLRFLQHPYCVVQPVLPTECWSLVLHSPLLLSSSSSFLCLPAISSTGGCPAIQLWPLFFGECFPLSTP